jgi:hypothetical protein
MSREGFYMQAGFDCGVDAERGSFSQQPAVADAGQMLIF